jgi:hypothetical protein
MFLMFLAQSDNGSVFVLFLFLIFVVAIIGAISKKKPKPLRPNECPNCHKDTVETRQKFFGGSYRRCKRRFLCGYDERKVAAEKEEAAQRQARRTRDRQLDERQAGFDRRRAELNFMAYDQQQSARRQAESDGR